MPGHPSRLVLDTNVCLDLFVFADAHAVALLQALRSGAVEAVTDEACREEWHRVLGYAQFGLDELRRAAAMRAFDALVRVLAVDDRAGVSAVLPRCADPDDQKFLELALACGAGWLLSKDNEVLRLGRRTLRDGLFRIATPQQWLASGLATRVMSSESAVSRRPDGARD